MYNDQMTIVGFVIISLGVQVIFTIFSMQVLRNYDESMSICVFYVSYIVYTACFSGTMIFYNYLLINSFKRFRIVNQILW